MYFSTALSGTRSAPAPTRTWTIRNFISRYAWDRLTPRRAATSFESISRVTARPRRRPRSGRAGKRQLPVGTGQQTRFDQPTDQQVQHVLPGGAQVGTSGAFQGVANDAGHPERKGHVLDHDRVQYSTFERPNAGHLRRQAGRDLLAGEHACGDECGTQSEHVGTRRGTDPRCA
jgi:hypothetical protein